MDEPIITVDAVTNCFRGSGPPGDCHDERSGDRQWPATQTRRHPESIPLVHPALYCRWVETATYGQVLARFGHALSDPIRSRLLLALREGPAYPADLALLLGTSRQNLSNHLACLRGCGLVVAAPEGRRTRYELADPHLAHALGDSLRVVLTIDPQTCDAAAVDQCC
jgi:ArsR family transcriptional regulator, cadmium/lead-responsive transcriptional repressor